MSPGANGFRPHTFQLMGSLTLHASGPAPVNAVWEAYADPQRWSQWSPHIRRVEAVGRLRPGLTGQVVAVVPLAVNFEVTKVDAKGHPGVQIAAP